MDDYNHMMESEQPTDQAYQSQMMTSVNSSSDNANVTAEITDSHESNELNESNTSCASDTKDNQIPAEGQSISDNGNDSANAKNDSTESIEQTNDKCATDTNDTNENEIENETETETDGKTNVSNDETQIEQQENPPDNGNNADETSEAVEDDAVPAVTANIKKEDEIELNQCRICMSADNLLDIFRIGDKASFRICDLIMKLAPAVKISERDFLPHSVCATCVDRIEAAYELRVQCEETDTFLRSKLKRSKKTRRTPSEYVVVDCAESSSDSDDDDQKSDDEFQLSEESEESSESDSDSSYDEKKKVVPIRRGGAGWKRGPPPKRTNSVTQQQPAKKPRTGIVYIKAGNSDDDNGRASKVAAAATKSVTAKPAPNRFQFRCDICNRPCISADALAQHRRIHVDEKCNICSMKFKQRSDLLQHMQRHKSDPDRVCSKCKRVFATKIECQRHVQSAHPQTIACTKCKRQFPNRAQLDAHKCAVDRKPPESSSKKKTDVDTSATGRDLFKSVAPLTTTYWSDSFSD